MATAGWHGRIRRDQFSIEVCELLAIGSRQDFRPQFPVAESRQDFDPPVLTVQSLGDFGYNST